LLCVTATDNQFFLVTGPSILIFILIENQQMHQNDHFIVMSSQTLLHVSAYWRHHQGAHMILTSYLYVDVHYNKNNWVSSKLAPVNVVTLWIQVVMTNSCWEQWTVVEHQPPVPFLYVMISLDISEQTWTWQFVIRIRKNHGRVMSRVCLHNFIVIFLLWFCFLWSFGEQKLMKAEVNVEVNLHTLTLPLQRISRPYTLPQLWI
jgi:hypothetical protein